MSEYRVLAPCVYVQDGSVVRHKRPGAVVELSDEVAAELGDQVSFVDRSAPPAPESVEGPTGAVLPAPVTFVEAPEPEADPEVTDPEVDELAKPRRSRSRGSDG